tara:strand:+ start:579 stop:1586 length:1008 start_codon:yes stop_codon:yes gene_type:complete
MYKKVYYRTQHANYQPVAKFMSPDHIQGFCTAEEAHKLVHHLTNYGGTHPLMAEMRDKFKAQNGSKQSGLSEKQWSIVRKNRKNLQIETPSAAFVPVMFLHPCAITVNKGAAFSHFKKKLGMKYGIFTLKVLAIDNIEKSRGGSFYKVTMRVKPDADGAVSACRVCGKALTDHTSIATGIGPTCAKKVGAMKAYKSDVKKFMEEVKKEFDKVGVTVMTTWHTNIVDGLSPIMAEIKSHFEKPSIDIEHCTISTDHIEWVPQTKTFSVDLSMDKHPDIQMLYNVLRQNKKVYLNVVNPKTTNWHKFELTNQTNNTWTFIPCDLPVNNKVQSLIVKQ